MPLLEPPSGNGETFSGAYNLLSSQPTLQLLGATDTEEVQQLTVQALPSNVVFHLRFPVNDYVPAIVASLTSQFAGYFNALAAIPNVTGVATVQDINDAGQVQDVMLLTVRSTSGRTSFQLRETQFGRQVSLISDEVAALVASLDQIEAGH